MKILQEFKDLLIPLTDEERNRLEESLEKDGCRDAIIVWKKGKDTILIDGHNRYEICERNNIEYKTKNKDFVDEDEAKLFIISNQLSRRNLTPFNKAILALKMKKSMQEKARQNLRKSRGRGKKGSMISSKVNTNESLAKTFGVSPQTIARAEYILKNGSKEQIEKVQKDKASVNAIFKEIKSKEVWILQGDSFDKLDEIEENSVDLILTDPPYGIGIDKWDKTLPVVEIWKKCLRVLKPGAFAYVMTGSNQDKLSEAIRILQQSGFITKYSSLYWTYLPGGMVKGTDISKQIDKKFGLKGKLIERKTVHSFSFDREKRHKQEYEIREPKHPQAKEMKGAVSGFNPKPALEVILIAQKPLEKNLTITEQAIKNKKGGTWIEDIRIPAIRDGEQDFYYPSTIIGMDGVLGKKSKYVDLYAWAEENVNMEAVYEEAYNSLPEEVREKFPFILVNKPSKKEKNTGMEEGEENLHKTVKPILLFAYLCTMGSREDDTILDPFMGSGTTLIAAKVLKRKPIGIDKSPEYARLVEKRYKAFEKYREFLEGLIPLPSKNKYVNDFMAFMGY